MNRIKKHISRVLVSFLILLPGVVHNASAQNVSVSAEMDSTVIFIGGQIDLKLQLSQPDNMELNFPLLTDTITKNIEIVRASQIDTLNKENGRYLIEQSLRITSFDSGLHYIPPIVFEEASQKLGKAIQTEPMALMVVNPFDEVDPQKGIVDIKQPMQAPFHLSELYKYLPWVLGIILLAGIVTFIILRYFGKEVPVKIFAKPAPVIPPHVKALEALDKIKQEKLWQHNRIKEYYSGVSDTLRHYIEERFEIRAMEQTTDEIMDSFKGIDFRDGKSIDNLRQILITSDLVKFAKHEPLPDENDLSMINAFFFVNQTKLEEIKSLEEEKEAMLNKENEVLNVSNSSER
ncbi:hypothetical protein KDU71_04700 [Carboxylicivirga sediminis]|uniref:Protein BatD n=1 Tax=Carboxylicivirga sediminis TaxID=2006564 RepID=A0A941F329_9BACT|nr:hypothetical protein [Carboxylicivirga sediminis]MBR8534850.1 hypothetical protein [Carboxylicivirga sediminis]